MPRARLISPEFWTSESVVDCPPMTRLLLLGLSTFADDFGVLPLRPRTLRMQVFPGDALDDDQMRAMIEELVARGLVRRYAVEGVEYLSIVDWAVHQRVGKRARRRYPVPAEDGPVAVAATPDDSNNDSKTGGSPSAAPDGETPRADPPPDVVAWHAAVEYTVRRNWGNDVPADLAQHAQRWRAQGRDLEREVLPAIVRVINTAVYFKRPLHLDLELVDAAIAEAMLPARENHSNRAAG